MSRRLSFVVIVLLLPTLASAQRTRGGSRGGKMSFDSAGGPRKTGIMSPKDLERENMVNFVLDKRKDLKLSDDEVKSLKEINDRAKDSVSVSLRTLDSIGGQMRRTGDLAPSNESQQLAKLLASQKIDLVRAQYDGFLKEALAKLTDDQQKSANDLIMTRRKELTPDK
jgi:hypothetical protein